jgi:DNA-binding NarL/FixJ family response regulator
MSKPAPSSAENQRTSGDNVVRVVVFESTRMGSELLARALESSRFALRVTGTYTSSLVPIEDLDTDVAVITPILSDGPVAGFSVLKRLAKMSPRVQCVMLFDRDDKEMVIEAFRSGAMGVCERNEPYEVLCKCICSVHSGQVWANSQQLRYVLGALASGISTRITNLQGQPLLSSREEQIVLLVAEGFKNREIAESLSLSQHTVKNHLFRIFERLGISSRAELILYLLGQKNSLGQGAGSPPTM